MNRYDSVTPWPGVSQDYPPGTNTITELPARQATFLADVCVPVCQAALTGVLLSSLMLFLAVRFWQFDGDRLTFWVGWTLALTTGTWCVLLRQHRRLLWLTEHIGGGQVPNGGHGETKERLVFLDRERARSESEQARRQDAWSDFLDFVRGLEHRGTSLAAWQKRLPRAVYAEYRDALLDYGAARWNSYKPDGTPNVSQGWTLTVSPADILARLSVD